MTKTCTSLDLSAFDATRSAVEKDPAAGVGGFRTVTTWEDGARARTTARSFTIETDEPAPLGGTDAAVDPMELLLAAAGTCLTIGWVTPRRTPRRRLPRPAHRRRGRLRPAGLPGPRRRGATRLRDAALHRLRRHRRRQQRPGGDPCCRRSQITDDRQHHEPHPADRDRRTARTQRTLDRVDQRTHDEALHVTRCAASVERQPQPPQRRRSASARNVETDPSTAGIGDRHE